MSYNPYAYASGNNGAPEVHDRATKVSGGAVPPPAQPFQGNPIQPQFQNQYAQQQPQAQGQQAFGFQDPRNTMAFQIGQSAFSNFIGQENFNQFQQTVSKATGDSSTLSHYFQVSTLSLIHI